MYGREDSEDDRPFTITKVLWTICPRQVRDFAAIAVIR